MTGRIRLPGHNHPGVQHPRERHCYWLMAAEISGKVSVKRISEVPIEGLLIKYLLRLPLSRVEIAVSTIDQTISKDPCGSWRQNVNIWKQSSVFEHRSPAYELAQSRRINPTKFRTH